MSRGRMLVFGDQLQRGSNGILKKQENLLWITSGRENDLTRWQSL